MKYSVLILFCSILLSLNVSKVASQTTSGKVLPDDVSANPIFFNNGRVGLGHNNPSENLLIYNNQRYQTVVQFGNLNTNVGNGNGFIVGIESAGNGILWNRSNNFIRFGTNSLERLRILANGNVGIGTPNPQSKLHVNGSFTASDAKYISSSGHTEITSNAVGSSHELLFGATRTNYGWLHEGHTSFTHSAGEWGRGAGAIRFLANGGRMDFFVSPTSTGAGTPITWNEPAMVILRGNNVGIGTTSPQSKLHVNGTIRATEIQVLTASVSNLSVDGDMHANNIRIASNGQTADFVFESDYNLRSLNELESFIIENKHLPEIPSATDMESNGVDLAEMNKLLLMKIEELTLYVIEQQKAIEELRDKQR